MEDNLENDDDMDNNVIGSKYDKFVYFTPRFRSNRIIDGKCFKILEKARREIPF